MTRATERLHEALDDMAALVPEVPEPERPRLAAKAQIVVDLLAGRLNDCDSPPDLNGQCLRCGAKTAPPVADHKRGCIFAPLVVVARPAVRVARFTRSIVVDLRGGD